jgi:hypothetical protein
MTGIVALGSSIVTFLPAMDARNQAEASVIKLGVVGQLSKLSSTTI